MSQPTNSRRNRRQKVKQQYSKAREEAQLLDLIPTIPQGAVRDERAVPEGESPTDPKLVRQAVRNGWAVPDEKKPRIVDELVSLVEAEIDPHVKVAAARTLRTVDRDQWERDHPELAGKTKGTVTQTNQQTGVVLTAEGVLAAVLAAAGAPSNTQQRLAELEQAEREVKNGTLQGSGNLDSRDSTGSSRDGGVRAAGDPAVGGKEEER